MTDNRLALHQRLLLLMIVFMCANVALMESSFFHTAVGRTAEIVLGLCTVLCGSAYLLKVFKAAR